MNTTRFKVKEPFSPFDFCYIPTIHSISKKILGRVIDWSLTDKKYVKEMEEKLLAGLKVIDKSHFSGSQKLWTLQDLLIPNYNDTGCLGKTI